MKLADIQTIAKGTQLMRGKTPCFFRGTEKNPDTGKTMILVTSTAKAPLAKAERINPLALQPA